MNNKTARSLQIIKHAMMSGNRARDTIVLPSQSKALNTEDLRELTVEESLEYFLECADQEYEANKFKTL